MLEFEPFRVNKAEITPKEGEFDLKIKSGK